jgi:hypothetical protein
MKLLLSLALILFSFCAQASVNFTYSETPEFLKPKLIDILEIQSDLEHQGYYPVDLTHDLKLHALGVDQAFFDITTKKYILLKFGQKVSDPSLIGKLIPFEGDYLFHGENTDKVPYALYFLKHSESEASEVLKAFGAKPQISLLNFLIPEAKATSCSTAALAAAAASPMFASQAQVIQRLWNCLMTAGTGSISSVQGMARGAMQFLEAGALFRRNPQAAWNRITSNFEGMGTFFDRIGNELSELRRLGIDSETGFHIFCTVLGELAPGILTTIATGGTAAGVLAWNLPSLALKLNKIRQLLPVLRRLSEARRAGVIRGSEAVERVVSCAR